MLAQLDKIPGVEHSYVNVTGDMVRISVAAAADRDQIAKQVLKVLADGARSPVRLTGADLAQALKQEEWRRSDRVGELSLIEYRTLGLRRVRTFAQTEKLSKETTEKLLRIAEEEWGSARKQRGAPQDPREVDWPGRFRQEIKAVVDRAKSVLTSEQVDRLRESLNRLIKNDGHALGTVDFPITGSPQAQAEFNRAVVLLHHIVSGEQHACRPRLLMRLPTPSLVATP